MKPVACGPYCNQMYDATDARQCLNRMLITDELVDVTLSRFVNRQTVNLKMKPTIGQLSIGKRLNS